MRIACPACGAIYEIPDRLLGDGPRRLRCARCAHDWNVERPAAEAPPPPAIAPPPVVHEPRPRAAPAPPDTAQTEGGRQRLALGLAWAATGLFVVGIGAGLLVWPAAVTEAFPPAARLYDALGVPTVEPGGESALSTSPAR